MPKSQKTNDPFRYIDADLLVLWVSSAQCRTVMINNTRIRCNIASGIVCGTFLCSEGFAELNNRKQKLTSSKKNTEAGTTVRQKPASCASSHRIITSTATRKETKSKPTAFYRTKSACSRGELARPQRHRGRDHHLHRHWDRCHQHHHGETQRLLEADTVQ